MARYTGPKTRIARKFGEAIFGADKVLSKKNYPPGQHPHKSGLFGYSKTHCLAKIAQSGRAHSWQTLC